MAVQSPAPMQIDLFSDVVCPWCFIGKRRLEQALEHLAASGRPGPLPQVRWRAFQLNPGLPPAGMERSEYVSRKFGSGAAGIYARVAAVGSEAGIAFAFDRIARQPNTVDAHRLIRLAGETSQQDAMAETLFQAYFVEGADLSRTPVLLDLAQRAGLERSRAQACLSDEATRAAVLEEDREARELGIEGVPFFVFDRRLAVSGAQPAEVLAQAVERATREVMHN
jgi:predicted DsbA family dithiol-disulfide isomerase